MDTLAEKLILGRKNGFHWWTVRELLAVFPECVHVAIGTDAETGDDKWIADGAIAYDQSGYHIWRYADIMGSDFTTWIFWLTLHLFGESVTCVELIGEDADLFNKRHYRQNPAAMAEIYVWDSTEAVLLPAPPAEHRFNYWRPKYRLGPLSAGGRDETEMHEI